MRVNRSKLVRKYLRFFKIVYGIEPPFRIILDANFIFNALKYKLDLRDRIGKLLQDERFQFYVTESALTELKDVGPKAKEAFHFASSQCQTINDKDIMGTDPVSKLKYLLEANLKDPKEKKYFVATLDKDLRHVLSSLPGVPLIYLNKVIFILERPSKISQEYNREVEASKTVLNTDEVKILSILSTMTSTDGTSGSHYPSTGTPTDTSAFGHVARNKMGVGSNGQEMRERRKRKAAEANPLSCLKPSEDSHATKRKKAAKYKR